MNYYRHFPGDYLRDTIHLSAAQDGMYRRLLDAQYTSEKPLPLDRTLLYATVRANTEDDKTAVESILSQFFIKTRHGFINRRVKKELLRTKEISEKRVNAAKSSSNKRAFAEHLPSKRRPILDSRLQTKHKTPLPPASGGEQVFTWSGETVAVSMGRHRRLPNLSAYHGARAEDVAEFLRGRGFEARVVENIQ